MAEEVEISGVALVKACKLGTIKTLDAASGNIEEVPAKLITLAIELDELTTEELAAVDRAFRRNVEIRIKTLTAQPRASQTIGALFGGLKAAGVEMVEPENR